MTFKLKVMKTGTREPQREGGATGRPGGAAPWSAQLQASAGAGLDPVYVPWKPNVVDPPGGIVPL
ncbi:hypothetical protein GCM10027610_087100 [Dactylosporangium cerinum]